MMARDENWQIYTVHPACQEGHLSSCSALAVQVAFARILFNLFDQTEINQFHLPVR